LQQDIRTDQPSGPFDLVLCRNVAFTYFDEPAQRRIVSRLAEQMATYGFLVVGRHETLPSDAPFVPYAVGLGIYRRTPIGVGGASADRIDRINLQPPS
jgi:chemotaxis protein methyltransferase CheR